GDNLWGIDVVDLLVQAGGQRSFTQVGVELFLGGLVFQVQVQDRHGDIWGRYADGVTGQLAFELRKGLGYCLGGTGFGDHHVQRCRTAAALALVEVVDQVLVVGERVNGLDVSVGDTELVVQGLEHWGDGIGGARCSGDDLVICGDPRIVDAVDDVLQIALARCGQQDAGNTLGLQVLGQASLVAPAAGVVYHDGVVDAVCGVVNG